MFSLGQTVKHISLSFNMDDFNLVQDDNCNIVITSNLYRFKLKTDTLLPALPFIGYNVLVKNGESFEKVICSSTKTVVQKDIMMATNPDVFPTNMIPSLTTRKRFFSYGQTVYPQQYVEYVGKDDYNGYRLLTFLVCPFEYNSETKTLLFRNTIDFDIHLDCLMYNSPIMNVSKKDEKLREKIRKMIVNPEDLVTTRNNEIRYGSNTSLTKQTGYEYVIVTSNKLKDVFQELSLWKSQKGIRSKVITTEEIYSTYNGETKQEKIKRALADIDNLSYVLLGGDTTQVPTCMCFIDSEHGSSPITPADSYYACLGTMNWDHNGNGVYGEFEDSISIVPTLNVSRAPVLNEYGARSFINHIINYESNPDTTNWHDNILMSGTSLGHKDNGVWHPVYDPSSGISDTQIWSQMMYNTYINPADSTLPSWNGEQIRFYDTYTDISGDDTYDFNVSNLKNELSKGYTFIDIKTHGSEISLQMEGDAPSFYSNNVASIVNSGYSIITTTACLTNAFDFEGADRCLSFSFMNKQNCNILAYWGTSRENWHYSRLDLLGLGATYDGLTYRKLIENRYHRIGEATTAVKLDMRELASEGYDPDRKIWMSLNLMGDPEMPVYMSKPQYFHNVDH